MEEEWRGGRLHPAVFEREFHSRKASGHTLSATQSHGTPGEMRNHVSFGFVDHTTKEVLLVGLWEWKERLASPEFILENRSFKAREELYGPAIPCPIAYPQSRNQYTLEDSE